jgi:hypothetical protein
MTLFQNAEQNQNVTSFHQEHVIRTVTTMLNVPLILATLQPDNATTHQTTTDVTITTNVLLTDVPHKDVFIDLKIAQTTMHVPKTSAMQLLDHVYLLLSLAHPQTAESEAVTRIMDAPPLLEIATTKLHVQLIAVMRTMDAYTFQMTNFAMTMMHLLLINAQSNTENAYTRKLNVTTTTLALKMFW